MKRIRKVLPRLLFVFLLGSMLLVCVYFRVPCLFRRVTGLICPGCGLSRAWLCAFRLNFVDAFHFHPLFWSVPILVLCGFFGGKSVRIVGWNGWILVFLLIVWAVVYAIRLVSFLQGNLSI